jgi:hypothetical protein
VRDVRSGDPLMPTAHELRGIHAAHEAGMHDKKRKPEVCKMCAREDKEQEATDMAKVKTQCQCGGTFDGTPSGRKAHDATAKHRDWSAGQLAEKINETLTEPQPETPEATALADDSRVGKVIVGLADVIAERSRERDRRVVDHKWRVANRPDQAGEYFDSKVAPLQKELGVLQDAKAALVAFAEAGIKDLLAD